jgi:HEPN domain-containing protein
MCDLDHALLMSHIALNDFKALKGMTDPEIFSDEIFGFHAHQAVEKALKAWLSLVGVNYPKIHDIEELFALLSDHGENIPDQFGTLIDLTDFAVQFRYDFFDESDTELDREKLIQNVQQVLSHVDTLLSKAEIDC